MARTVRDPKVDTRSARLRLTPRREPYWSKLSPGRANVNSTTSFALADMAGGATFFDNLVEVRAWLNTEQGMALENQETP